MLRETYPFHLANSPKAPNADLEVTDIEKAVDRVIFGAFYQSGQSCISVQRIMVHESIYERFRDRLVEQARALKSGDPRDEDTFIGPMISEEETARLEGWIGEALREGATLLCGGGRDGSMMPATILENVPENLDIYRKEAFGPVAVMNPFRDFEEALSKVNDSAITAFRQVFLPRISAGP